MLEQSQAGMLAVSAHALLTARAKHRRAVDTTVDLLRDALEALDADQQTEFSAYVRQCITSSISDLLKSKPEPGAWTE
jgi:hypothetical protein